MCSYNYVCIFYNYVCVFIIMCINNYVCVFMCISVLRTCMFNFVAPSMQVQDTQAVCLPGEAELQMGNDS